MVAVAEVTGLISFGISIASRLIDLAESAQRNREKCSALKKRVERIKDLLTELQSGWTPKPGIGRLLRDLNDALDDGKALVQSCQERRTWSLVFRTRKKARMFDDLEQRISTTLEMFNLANMIVIVNYSSRNNNNDDGAAAAAKACDVKVQVVVELAVSIVQEAKKQRRHSMGEEIQQLVQFVEKAANEMKALLQSSNLSWGPRTKQTVDDLEDHLHQARNILAHHNDRPHSNYNRIRMSRAFSCAGGGGYSLDEYESDKILDVAYKIEYYVQMLPVTIHI